MKKKQIFAIFLTFVMLFTSFCTVTAENTETAVEEVTVAPIDTDEYKTLYAMGFLGDELAGTDKDAYITRAQFIGYLFKVAGYTANEYKTDDIPFQDVSTATPYYNEICTMYEMGRVNGTEPNEFSPKAHVTYAQACKLIVDVLGYRGFAEIKYGEYPEGYIAMAAELEINEGVKNVKWNAELTAEDAVKMLYNAGMAEVMTFSGIDKFGNPTYETDGTTLFESNDIYYAEGTMQSDGICSMSGDDPRYGISIIDNVNFVSADCDLSDLVGCKVKYFYRDDKVSKKLLYATLDKRFSSMLTFKAEELAITSSNYSLTNVVYYEANGDTESAKISPIADVIYNYSRCGVPVVEDIKPMTGTMRLIDNNDDEIYDVVIVEEYKNIFVKNTADDNTSIVGKYGDTLKMGDYEDFKIIKDGVEIAASEIGGNVVVSYVENREKTRIYIYVTNKRNKEVIKTSRVSRGRTLYGFESGEYRLSNTYTALMNDVDRYVVSPVIGKEYTYYLDMEGEIAEFQEAAGDMQYALLMSARAGEVYEDAEAYTRLLLTNENKVTGAIEKKVVVNGTKKTAAEFLADPRLTDDVGEVKAQIVKVAFDSEGNLSKIDFAKDIRSETDLYPYGYDPTSFSLDFSDYAASIRDQDGYRMLVNKYLVKNETVVFAKWDDSEEREPYSVEENTMLTTGSYYKEVYDIDSDLTIGAVYRTGLNTKQYWHESAMLVDEISYVYENDQEVKQISGYISGTYTSFTEYEPGSIPDSVKHGDFIRISVQNNKITNINVEVSAEEFANKTSKVVLNTDGSIPDRDGERAAVFAQLYNVSPYGVTVLTPPEYLLDCGKIMSAGVSGSVPVTIYDVKNDEMHVGDIYDVYQLYAPDANGEVTENSDSVMIYMRMRYWTLKEVVVARY